MRAGNTVRDRPSRDSGACPARAAHGAAARADCFIVAARLRELAHLLTLSGAPPFRARAYAGGAGIVEALGENFAALLAAKTLQRVRGIGPGLDRVIEELSRTGTTATLERLRSQYPPAVVELSRVTSLQQARALADGLGIETLDELREACRVGSVRRVRGFGARREAQLMARIDALREQPARLLLSTALAEGEALLAYLQRQPAVERVEIAGQVRRRCETIDRLDFVVAAASPAAVIDVLRGVAVSPLRQEGDTIRLRLPIGVEARFAVVTLELLPLAWVEATGSAAHLAKLQQRTAQRGCVLTSRSLRCAGTTVHPSSEADLYRRLALLPIAPELRDDAGEIEAAAADRLPQLVRLEDLRGIVHCHTTYSDGKASIEAMARGAAAMGMDYLTITDHSQTASYAGGLTTDRVYAQRAEIAAAQERVGGIRILHGIESDILRDGGLDYPDAVLEQFDVIIASVPNRYRLNAVEMTRRIVRAMQHPCFKIWGHALGRYVLSRPSFECDVEEILDVIAASRAAIEINGEPNRLDLEPRWIRPARARGIKFVLSADAHSVKGLNNVRWAVDMARRGWLESADVLNCLAVEPFVAAVRPELCSPVRVDDGRAPPAARNPTPLGTPGSAR